MREQFSVITVMSIREIRKTTEEMRTKVYWAWNQNINRRKLIQSDDYTAKSTLERVITMHLPLGNVRIAVLLQQFGDHLQSAPLCGKIQRRCSGLKHDVRQSATQTCASQKGDARIKAANVKKPKISNSNLARQNSIRRVQSKRWRDKTTSTTKCLNNAFHECFSFLQQNRKVWHEIWSLSCEQNVWSTLTWRFFWFPFASHARCHDNPRLPTLCSFVCLFFLENHLSFKAITGVGRSKKCFCIPFLTTSCSFWVLFPKVTNFPLKLM